VTGIYRLFGLRVSSELALPLPTVEGDAEVEVTLGPVAAGGDLLWHTEPPVAFSCFRRGETIVLEWPGARFGVEPDRVVVDVLAPDFAVDLFLNPVWSVLLTARGREPLHACAVARNGRAVSIHGVSGAGKTTSGLALLDRDWRLVTDDLLVLDDLVRAVPGPPFVRLLPDRATGRSGEFDPAGKLRFRPLLAEGPVPLTVMIVLGETHERCARLTGAAAVDAILAQVYSPVLTHPDQPRRRFELAIELAEHVAVYGAPPRSLTPEQLEHIAEARPS
jgi:hypothetical protein